jgi:hypothetical protein
VEELRWAKAEEPQTGRRSPSIDIALQKKRGDDLAAARRRLQNATMLAHLPRGVVEEYDHLALAAHQSSKESLAAEQRASVPGPVSDCVEAAYQLMCDLLWHPVLSRLTYRWRFRKLLKLVAEN